MSVESLVNDYYDVDQESKRIAILKAELKKQILEYFKIHKIAEYSGKKHFAKHTIRQDKIINPKKYFNLLETKPSRFFGSVKVENSKAKLIIGEIALDNIMLSCKDVHILKVK